MRNATAAALSLLLLSTAPAAELLPVPPTPKEPVVDIYHGVKVIDNYRWLEDSGSPAVKQWSDAENVRARKYLATVPHQAEIGARVDRLIRSNSVAYAVVVKRGGRLFAFKNDPKLQQPMIVTLASADDLGSERVIVDPNAIDAKGGTEIDWFVVSLDGGTLAVSLSKGGSEAGDLHLYDVATAAESGEVIPGVQKGTAGGSAAFSPDGRGFWYTRYPRGSEHGPEDAGFYQQVWFHRIGTRTESDTYELGRDLPKIAEIALETKEDGRWVEAEVKNGDGGEVAYYLRSTATGSPWIQISSFADQIVQSAFGKDDALYLKSRKDAPKGKILRLALGSAPSLGSAVEIVKQSDASIDGFWPTQSRLYINDVVGGPSRVRVFGLGGKPLADLPLPALSAVEGALDVGGDDILLEAGGYLELPAWSYYSAREGTFRKTSLVRTSLADYSDTEVVREYAKSKDGTKVPLEHHPAEGNQAGRHQPHHPLRIRRLWRQPDAELLGLPPHLARRRAGSTSCQSCAAAANSATPGTSPATSRRSRTCSTTSTPAPSGWWTHQYTTSAKLAIFGGSNGGLLMGAALTQHPEFYRAVVSRVGIYDMLRVGVDDKRALST